MSPDVAKCSRWGNPPTHTLRLRTTAIKKPLLRPPAAEEEEGLGVGRLDPKGGQLSRRTVAGQICCLDHLGFYFVLFLFEITSWAGEGARVPHSSGYTFCSRPLPSWSLVGLIRYLPSLYSNQASSSKSNPILRAPQECTMF